MRLARVPRLLLAVVSCVLLAFLPQAALLRTASAPATEQPQQPLPVQLADYDIPGGHFFTQTASPGRGFSVTDGGTDSSGRPVRFWSEFQRLGGLATLGYPISRRYTGDDGFVYQAFQRGVLQWHPEDNAAWLVNSLDLLHDAGRDGWLAAQYGIPPAIVDDGSGGDLARATRIRLGWLTNERIRAHFLANPSPDMLFGWSQETAIELYGLPASQPERRGPFIIQRFQRAALQLWVENVPGMPPAGQVVGILAGDLLKESGLLPRPALEPEPAPPVPLIAGFRVEPPTVPQGGTVLLRVLAPQAATVVASLDDRRIPFTRLGDEFVALVGFSRAAAPGLRPIVLSATDPAGRTVERREPFDTVLITDARFPIEQVFLPPERLQLASPENIAAENAKLAPVFSHVTPQRLWSGPFIIPVQGRITSTFGVRRAYNNGPPTGSHEGIDYGVPPGTPVPATNSGIVALAEPLVVRGNAVIIDHGLGLYSAYYHLSEIRVTPGQPVEKGTIIGLSGNTGFSSGPHLHWELRVHNVNVNPMQWVERPVLSR
jgi:murein DD-endopeptidase MepM/ murein hydrolase activator NlpD